VAIQRTERHFDVSNAPASPPELHIIRTPPPPPRWKLAYQWGLASADFGIAAAGLVFLVYPFGGLPALLLAVVGGGMLTAFTGLARGYNPTRAGTRAQPHLSAVRSVGIWVLVSFVPLYFLSYAISPGRLLAGFAMVLLGTQLTRVIALGVLARGRAAGRFRRDTIILGGASHADELGAVLGAPGSNFNVLGICTSDASSSVRIPVLGTATEALSVVEQAQAEVVIITPGSMDPPALRRLGWALEPHGVELLLAPQLEDVALRRIGIHPVAGTPLLNVELGSSRTRRLLKAITDRVLGSLLLLAASLPLLVICFAVRASSPGPAFFMQERIGIDGKRFRMFKLRSMYIDAEERRNALLQHSDGNIVMFKMHDDPRVTPIGRILRRFSLDELPQLLNVVRGEMSLVGPRPPLPEEVEGYSSDALRRLKVKPGLTGLWQVSGRSDLDWNETIRLDLSYVDNWSMRMDLQILTRTFQAVIGGRGAY